MWEKNVDMKIIIKYAIIIMEPVLEYFYITQLNYLAIEYNFILL